MHFLNKLSKCDVSTVAIPREDVSANFLQKSAISEKNFFQIRGFKTCSFLL